MSFSLTTQDLHGLFTFHSMSRADIYANVSNWDMS